MQTKNMKILKLFKFYSNFYRMYPYRARKHPLYRKNAAFFKFWA